jgi:hypothetical protein
VSEVIVIGGDAEDIPPGTHPGTLTGIEVKHSDKFNSDFRVWKFTLDNGSVVEGTTSMFTNPKSKGGRWLSALVGGKVTTGQSVEPIGKRALVVVEIGPDEWPRVQAVVAEPSTTPQNAPGAPAAPGVAPSATEADGGAVLDF